MYRFVHFLDMLLAVVCLQRIFMMQYLRALGVVFAVVIQRVFAQPLRRRQAGPGPSSEKRGGYTPPRMVVSATRGGPRSAEDLPVSVDGALARRRLKPRPGLTIDEILRNDPKHPAAD